MYYNTNNSSDSGAAAVSDAEPLSPSSPSQQAPSISRRRHNPEVLSHSQQYASGGSSSYSSPHYAGAASSASYYNIASGSAAPPATPNLLGQTSAPSSPYKAVHAAWAPTSIPSDHGRPSSSSPGTVTYRHNTLTACFWLPCWFVVFWGPEDRHELPLQIFCILALITYGLDLIGAQEGVFYLIWLIVLVQSMLAIWFGLWLNTGTNGTVFSTLLESFVVTIFWVTTACWATLQCQWMAWSTGSTSDQDNISSNSTAVLRQTEAVLHGILPAVFAAFMTVGFTQLYLLPSFGSDVAGTAAPHVWCATLASAMLGYGAVESSFTITTATNYHKSSSEKQESNNSAVYVIRKGVAWGQVWLLLLVPPFMHLAMMGGRLFHPSVDDLCDFVLSVTVPVVCLAAMNWLHESNLRYSPYAGVLDGLKQRAKSRAGWKIVLPMATLFTMAVALQVRHLIPMCLKFAYRFMGVQPSPWLLTFYWTLATIALIGAGFFWGRVDSSGQPIFGEYHEDVVQLCLGVCGVGMGKAFGLPWNMTPLPVLGILGLSLWLYTRMIRYLAIFLFVIHATGLVVFTYRFIGIDQTLPLPLPGVSLSLARFGMVVIFSSIMIGTVTGLAVRSSGGYLAPLLKRMDAAGVTLICYSFLLTILEIALIKRPVPNKELAGVQLEEEDAEEMLYDQILVLLTSAVLIGISLFMKRVRIIDGSSAAVISSMAIGKAIAVFIDSAETNGDGTTWNDPAGTTVLIRALVAALLCAVMFAPRIFLQPVHFKTSRRSSFNRGQEIPPSAMRTIVLYVFGFLPVTLMAAIPYVLVPLINVIAGIYRSESYYSVSTPISELLGSSVCLWGLACLSMLNFYLPDGGGEALKKLSALAFLMGLGIVFTAPTMGSSVGNAAHSPYASMSSLGSQLITRSKSRTGGWGILSAALATLLAGLGPLELKERRSATGRKDKHLMFRTMIFSLLFGGGVSWFIAVQSMSQADWLFLLLTLIASIALAFLATVAAVLGHFVESENFDEVEMVTRTWFVALIVFLPIAGIPQLFRSGNLIHPFGNGGWLSTYLTVASISAIAFSLSLSFRHGKDRRTRGLGNIGCLVSWMCATAVLYGRYGIAGLDTNYGVTSFAGIPATVIGTILIGILLLGFEGEKSVHGFGRRVSVTADHKITKSVLQLNLDNLTRDNRWFPPFALTVLVFLLTSLYTILLRGSGLIPFGSSVARSHEDIFASVFGFTAAASDGNLDLATLAQKTTSHSLAFSIAAKLAGSGFWTANGLFGPLLHLAGVMATLPNFFLLFNRHWLRIPVPSSQVAVCLPLNVIPIVLCRGIPGLRAGSLLIVVGAIVQLLASRQAEQTSRMRL